MPRRARLLVGVAAAFALAACSSPPTPGQAKSEAVAMLDRVAAVAAGDRAAAERGESEPVDQCAWLPGAPTSKKAWELWRRYGVQGASSDEAVGKLVDYARAQGGAVAFDNDDPRRGRYTRIEADGMTVFASARPVLEIRVRSRCFQP